jgi:hypothetical protein
MRGGVGDPAGCGRTELWVLPDIGSAHPASRALYCVPIPTRADLRTAAPFPLYRVPTRADRWNAIAVPSVRRFLTVRTCLQATV